MTLMKCLMSMMDPGLETDKIDRMELNNRKKITDCHLVMMFQLTVTSSQTMRILVEGDLIALENRKKNQNQRAESKKITNSEGT
jgi:hypothetical protein